MRIRVVCGESPTSIRFYDADTGAELDLPTTAVEWRCGLEGPATLTLTLITEGPVDLTGVAEIRTAKPIGAKG